MFLNKSEILFLASTQNMEPIADVESSPNESESKSNDNNNCKKSVTHTRLHLHLFDSMNMNEWEKNRVQTKQQHPF